MASSYLDMEDDIAALATPQGQGALAVVRVCGPGSVVRMARAFSRPEALQAAPGHTAVVGHVLGADGAAVDEAVLLVFKGPASYTGQDGVDLSCHGGPASATRVLAALEIVGFRPALPGEFTFRAFAGGKLDLARAEAVGELVAARTVAAQADALARLSGGLSREIESIKTELVRLAAACALRLDYGDDEAHEGFDEELPALSNCRKDCSDLAATFAVGRLLQDGASIAAAGRTNAGKSSLFNRLLREERAIVSEFHGTTRDYVEAALDLDGIPVRLLDTAGVRQTDDPVEAEGMRRSRLVASGADLVLYVVDAIVGLFPEDESFLAAHPGALRVWNKIDSPRAFPAPEGWLAVSAETGAGEPWLIAAIKAALLGHAGPTVSGASPSAGPAGVRISSARQKAALIKAASALGDAESAIKSRESLDMVAVDLSAALSALGEISGETTPEDILDSLFSNFCVGK
ncbi:MAG: tRNA uridine-5-carboxymethylaminomethyl(34) synthesis GTPase MnmE [Spirochaetes bacterium RIFOXYC1_FULL_54_7]|nr:MAG: tRNA uridine-5-carboxymethylaminomethyl(34) synthesis GTPase MnmE [Spirochaetes bacterium RIFOXYC1_FULL_54_7]